MSAAPKPALCIGCGCDERHGCVDNGVSDNCWWTRFDAQTRTGVCSMCEDLVKAWDAGERALQLDYVSDRFYRQVMFLYHDMASAYAWLRSPQPVLANCIPRELILAGRLDEVQAVLDQIRDGVYS